MLMRIVRGEDILLNRTHEQTYLYVINYSKEEKALCQLEMKSLFNQEPSEKYFFSHLSVDPSRSPFFKLRLTVLCSASSFEALEILVREEEITCGNFKFARFKIEDGALDYATWLSGVTALGKAIQAEVDMKNPSIQFGITIVEGLWIFGIYEKNENPWVMHNMMKPFTNSNSLETRAARALVNIAVGQQVQASLVDPCCGIGTVVLEALSLAIDVTGYEISWIIANQAKQNVAHFGYDPCIVHETMHRIAEQYDVAILDLPYGLFSHVTHDQQKAIIASSRRITKKLVIITCVDMDEDITDAGFSIVDRCTVTKRAFVRYVRVCQ